MHRREAVKRISAMLGVMVSAPTMAGILSGCQPTGSLRTLSTAQHKMLAVMAEHIIPTTDTPGATEAGVADYIDAMLTDFYSEELRTQFLDGLKMADDQADEKFGASFMKCSTEEQFEMLDAMDEAAFPDMEAMSEAEREAFNQHRAENGRPFIVRLKELTIAGFYTSEVGATQELRVNPFGSYTPDVPYSEVGRAWA